LLNRSEAKNTDPAIDADIAQVLRGSLTFGSIAFHEGVAVQAPSVHLLPGYADCLPVIDGGCWRDPATTDPAEVLR